LWLKTSSEINLTSTTTAFKGVFMYQRSISCPQDAAKVAKIELDLSFAEKDLLPDCLADRDIFVSITGQTPFFAAKTSTVYAAKLA